MIYTVSNRINNIISNGLEVNSYNFVYHSGRLRSGYIDNLLYRYEELRRFPQWTEEMDKIVLSLLNNGIPESKEPNWRSIENVSRKFYRIWEYLDERGLELTYENYLKYPYDIYNHLNNLLQYYKELCEYYIDRKYLDKIVLKWKEENEK